jgi:hypothetical protein
LKEKLQGVTQPYKGNGHAALVVGVFRDSAAETAGLLRLSALRLGVIPPLGENPAVLRTAPSPV